MEGLKRNQKNNMAKKIIGIDLGGTNLRVALIENNKIIKYIKERTPNEKQKLFIRHRVSF